MLRTARIAVFLSFGRAVKSVTNILSMGIKRDSSDGCVSECVTVLDLVKKLSTNGGSGLRNCVYEALKKNSPEWAKKLVETSISKDGPAKRAVIGVSRRASSDVSRRLSKRDFSNLLWYPLLRRLSEYNWNEKFYAEVEEKLLAFIDISKVPLEAGICKACGVDLDDDDKELLCCLNPPSF
ncbi:hypothetical protein QVD17_09700 [Tagetes erecta]|uniref:Uncharacterized protein n=1 Tax=Tagetes erecta TaxID=13708 RepID=A0AAD8P599_TARER|nr:hypothetical protein QVD17_09700 [Tagetes erecta]